MVFADWHPVTHAWGHPSYEVPRGQGGHSGKSSHGNDLRPAESWVAPNVHAGHPDLTYTSGKWAAMSGLADPCSFPPAARGSRCRVTRRMYAPVAGPM